MSTPLVDQLKPLLQRLLTMAESHDERLARLEAAHSRLGTQMARIGEQLTRQSDQLSRIEETPVAPMVVRSSPSVESGVGGRFGEQVGRVNEQITRVREQFGRMLEQLNRIEQAQVDLRDEASHQGDEQRRLLERVETTVIRRQEEIAEQVPERVAQRIEATFGVVFQDEAEGAEVAAPPVPEVQPPSEIILVQEQVRQLGDRISELAAQLSRLAPPEPAPTPAPKPVASKPVIRPIVATKQVSR